VPGHPTWHPVRYPVKCATRGQHSCRSPTGSRPRSGGALPRSVAPLCCTGRAVSWGVVFLGCSVFLSRWCALSRRCAPHQPAWCEPITSARRIWFRKFAARPCAPTLSCEGRQGVADPYGRPRCHMIAQGADRSGRGARNPASGARSFLTMGTIRVQSSFLICTTSERKSK